MGTTFSSAVPTATAQASELNQFIAPVNAIEEGGAFWNSEAVGSAADAYVCAPSPAPPDPLTAGYHIRLLITNANTGASTLDVGVTGGAKAVKKTGGDALASGDLPAGAVAELVFDGTDWECQNPASAAAGASALADLTDVTITAAAKGDLLVYNGTDWVDLTVGTNDHVLTAASGEATGLKWAAAPGAGSFDPDTHMPWFVPIPVYYTETGNTNWTYDGSTDTNNPNRWLHGGYVLSTDANGNYIEWNNIVVSAGTWTVGAIFTKDMNRGIVKPSIDGGAALGSWDTYAGSTTANQKFTVTGVTVATTGKHTVRLTVDGKNGSSSGYYASLHFVWLARTA